MPEMLAKPYSYDASNCGRKVGVLYTGWKKYVGLNRGGRLVIRGLVVKVEGCKITIFAHMLKTP